MQFKAAVLFLVFSLSVTVIQVRCYDVDDDDDEEQASSLTYRENVAPGFPVLALENYDAIEDTSPKVKRAKNAVDNRIECADTEEHSRCDANPYCQRTCDNLNLPGIPCPRSKKSCIDGCICKKDFVRSELYGGCIPVDQCGRIKH